MSATLFGLVAAPTQAGTGSTDVLHINEILHNPEGADTPNEYVELKGRPNATIPANTFLVFVEGSSTTNGDVQTIFNVSNLTLGSNGFLALLQGSSTYTDVNGAATVVQGTGTGFAGVAGFQSDGTLTDIENEAWTAFLVTTSLAPSLTLDVDANNDGNAEIPASWTVLDAVAVDDDTTFGNGEQLYSIAKFSDGEWVGRPTGDPSGLDQGAWVGGGFANGTTGPNWPLNEVVQPSSYLNDLLDHRGGPNFPGPDPVIPEASSPIVLSALAALGMAGLVIARRRPTRRDEDGPT
jgi:hypothetical protein